MKKNISLIWKFICLFFLTSCINYELEGGVEDIVIEDAFYCVYDKLPSSFMSFDDKKFGFHNMVPIYEHDMGRVFNSMTTQNKELLIGLSEGLEHDSINHIYDTMIDNFFRIPNFKDCPNIESNYSKLLGAMSTWAAMYAQVEDIQFDNTKLGMWLRTQHELAPEKFGDYYLATLLLEARDIEYDPKVLFNDFIQYLNNITD